MDTSRSGSVEAVSPEKIASERKRHARSRELKRQIVEETLAPGASVARVARAHGVNANQVFAWRRQYRQGLLGAGKGMGQLLAVRVSETVAATGKVPTSGLSPGTIQVELAKGQLWLSGKVDGEALRVVLKELLA